MVVGDEGAQVSCQIPGEEDSDLARQPSPVMAETTAETSAVAVLLQTTGFSPQSREAQLRLSTGMRATPSQRPGTSDQQLQAGSLPRSETKCRPTRLLPREGQMQPGLRAPAGPMGWDLVPEGLG